MLPHGTAWDCMGYMGHMSRMSRLSMRVPKRAAQHGSTHLKAYMGCMTTHVVHDYAWSALSIKVTHLPHAQPGHRPGMNEGCLAAVDVELGVPCTYYNAS